MANISQIRKEDSLEIRKFMSDIKNHEIYFKKNKMRKLQRMKWNIKNIFIQKINHLASILHNLISFCQNKNIVFSKKDVHFYKRIIIILDKRDFQQIDNNLYRILNSLLHNLFNRRDHLRSLLSM